MGWTKQPASWICHREHDIPIDFLHPSDTFIRNEITRSVKWGLTNNIPYDRKDLADLRGKHIDTEATTCLYKPNIKKYKKSIGIKELRTYVPFNEIKDAPYVQSINTGAVRTGDRLFKSGIWMSSKCPFAPLTPKPFITRPLIAPHSITKESLVMIFRAKECKDPFTPTVSFLNTIP